MTKANNEIVANKANQYRKRLAACILAAGVLSSSCTNTESTSDSRVSATTSTIHETSVASTETPSTKEALSISVEQSAASNFDTIKSIVESKEPDLFPAMPEAIDGHMFGTVLKFVDNTDGTYTRYYALMQYSDNQLTESPTDVTVERVYVAKDTFTADVPEEQYGNDIYVDMTKVGTDWQVISKQQDMPDAEFSTTEKNVPAGYETLSEDSLIEQHDIMWAILVEMQQRAGLVMTESTIGPI